MKSIKILFSVLVLAMLVTSSSCTKKIKGCHMQLKADGQLLEFNDAMCVMSNNVFSMTLTEGSNAKLSFIMLNVDGNGTYVLDSVTSDLSLSFQLDDGSQVAANEIILEVTRYENNGMEGTFSGKGINTTNFNVLSITEGQFTAEF